MERLTSNNTLTETESMNLSLTDLYTRLKAYEDIGLAPEELKKKLRTLRHYEDKFGDRPAKRWDELCNAEDQGRLIVLPCKIGTPCFRIYSCSCQDFYREHYCKTREKAKLVNVRGIDFKHYSCKKIGNSTFALKDIANFGETVFLSREEAEKALEGMKCT